MIKELDQVLVNGLKKTIEEMKLNNREMFLHKCMELHDMSSIRFGNVIVGPPMSGKTEILNVVTKTYIDLFNT